MQSAYVVPLLLLVAIVLMWLYGRWQEREKNLRHPHFAADAEALVASIR